MSLFQELNWDKPDAENELCKFILDKQSTLYAQSKGLKDHQVFYTKEKSSGRVTRLLTENREVIYENQNLEVLCCHIDVISLGL